MASSCRDTNHKLVWRDIMGHDGTSGHHRSSADCHSRQYRGVGADGAATLKIRRLCFVVMIADLRVAIVCKRGVWPNENIIFYHGPIRDKGAGLNTCAIADDAILSDPDTSTNNAIPTNNGAGADRGKPPYDNPVPERRPWIYKRRMRDNYTDASISLVRAQLPVALCQIAVEAHNLIATRIAVAL